MDSTNYILSKLFESKDLDEASFIYMGDTYSAAFGRYSCNGDPIDADTYHNMRAKYDDTSILSRATKLANQEVNEFIEEFDIDIEETPEGPRGKRGHIDDYAREHITEDEDLFEELQDDLDMPGSKVRNVLEALHKYTTDDYDLATNEKQDLEKALDRLPVFQDGLLFRGMTFYKGSDDGDEVNAADWYLNQCGKGDLLKLRGFTSFSSDYGVAKTFTRAEPDEANFFNVMIINSRNLSGPSINHLSDYPGDEKEILCKQSTQLQIQDKKIKGNTVYLHVKELPMAEDTEPNVHVLEVEGNLHNLKNLGCKIKHK